MTPDHPIPPLEAAELAHVLRWYADMGVDAAVDEVPHDRFAESAAVTRQSQAPHASAPIGAAQAVSAHAVAPARSTPASVTASAQDAVLSAQDLAAGAKTLDALRAVLESFDGCGLKKTATQLCFADGNPQAKLMFVGEAPGADEDRQGKPFVGRAGQLLNRMVAAIGLAREDVYIANVVPWRPPGNRTPTPQETAICLPFVLRQIALVNPDIVMCLGGASAQTLLALKDGITKTRGRWHKLRIGGGDLPEREIAVMPTLHPAYLLRTPAHKRLAWQDFRAVAKALSGA
ncbi:uracil-DNA glycosylase [Methylovirgula sp. 4M-Z18]|uniref:uracil-DNA glycosylase n=1 Tax=Methylovirgula sp. 4M-Z18 TaxID=2293567 RepID=UPI000E2EE058|nr:uracil-DNA glycosylase family protein [Methylovirgula sp. 4M-Z18]RFB78882.1 uracil-DNA glycosylase [Methylovirgula sp. 4M-Z18]